MASQVRRALGTGIPNGEFAHYDLPLLTYQFRRHMDEQRYVNLMTLTLDLEWLTSIRLSLSVNFL